MKFIISCLATLMALPAMGTIYRHSEIELENIETTPVFDNYSSQCIGDIHNIYDNKKSPSYVNFRYENGVLYVNYTDIFLRGIQSHVPDGCRKFGYNDSGILRFGWQSYETNWTLELSRHFLWNMSFSLEYSGDFEVDLYANNASKEFEANKRITLSTYEGMDIDIRLDAYFDYYNQEFLYAKVKDGKTTGEYAVEKFIGTEVVDGKTYNCLYRSEGNEFDESKAELIAYMRHDGIKNYVLPPNKDLPLSMWVEGATGSVNLYEMCGGKEMECYNLFGNNGSYSFYDFPLGRLDLSDIVKEEGVFDYSETKIFESNPDPCRYLYARQLHRKATTSSGIVVIEDVGTLGDCVHSLAYPTFYGTDGNNAVQKLVNANCLDSDYRDENLYQEYVAGIDGVHTDNNASLRYADNRLDYLGDEPASLKIINMNGIVLLTRDLTGSESVDLSAMLPGAYNAIVESANHRQIRKILVK